MPRKCRDYFTAAEIARAFDVPADKIETVAGKKVYLNQIGLAMALQLMSAIA